MDIASILYSFLGVGGLAALIWLISAVKKWGASDQKKELADDQRQNAETAAAEIARQRDIANRPDTPVGDVLERMRHNDL